MVSDLRQYLAIESGDCVCDFPIEFSALQEHLRRCEEHNAVRLQITADLSDKGMSLQSPEFR